MPLHNSACSSLTRDAMCQIHVIGHLALKSEGMGVFRVLFCFVFFFFIRVEPTNMSFTNLAQSVDVYFHLRSMRTTFGRLIKKSWEGATRCTPRQHWIQANFFLESHIVVRKVTREVGRILSSSTTSCTSLQNEEEPESTGGEKTETDLAPSGTFMVEDAMVELMHGINVSIHSHVSTLSVKIL